MEFFENINVSVWILQTIAMMITALLIPRFTVSGPIGALLGVIGIAFVNAHVWDAALFFSIPDTLSVHAATVLIANGIIFWILVKILPGIDVQGILPAIIAPILFTFISLLLTVYAKDVDWGKVLHSTLQYVQGVRDDLKGEGATPNESTSN